MMAPGWIVIQRNRKGSSVESGMTEFWYGLKGLSCLTQTDNWEMRLNYQKTGLMISTTINLKWEVLLKNAY